MIKMLDKARIGNGDVASKSERKIIIVRDMSDACRDAWAGVEFFGEQNAIVCTSITFCSG